MTYRTANLQNCILYIYSRNTGTEYFKHGVYSPFFFSLSLKCSLFHNSSLIVSCIIHILYTECTKIQKNNSGAKRLKYQNLLCVAFFLARWQHARSSATPVTSHLMAVHLISNHGNQLPVICLTFPPFRLSVTAVHTSVNLSQSTHITFYDISFNRIPKNEIKHQLKDQSIAKWQN